MSDSVSDADSDSDTKVKAMSYILREICDKYKRTSNPTFTQDEVRERLLGLDPSYVKLNTQDLFRGSGLIEIDEELNITLSRKGIEFCKNDEIV